MTTTVQQDALDTVEPDRLFTPPEVCMFAQITYRQLDYWIPLRALGRDGRTRRTGYGAGWTKNTHPRTAPR